MALYMEESALKNIPLLSSLSRKFRQRRESRDSGAPPTPKFQAVMYCSYSCRKPAVPSAGDSQCCPRPVLARHDWHEPWGRTAFQPPLTAWQVALREWLCSLHKAGLTHQQAEALSALRRRGC